MTPDRMNSLPVTRRTLDTVANVFPEPGTEIKIYWSTNEETGDRFLTVSIINYDNQAPAMRVIAGDSLVYDSRRTD